MGSQAPSRHGSLNKSHSPLHGRTLAPGLSRTRRRRWFFLSFTLIIAIAARGYFVFKAHKASAPSGSTGVEYFDRLIALPEEKIDVGVVALNLAKDFYPGLDVDAYSQKIDELAAKVRVKVGKALDPGTRVRAINTVIYRDEKYEFDFQGVAQKNRDSSYLNRVLDTKRGNCLGLTLLYLSVAQRLGYPIYPVIMRDHVFLRYIGGDFRLYNIEASNGGGFSTDDDYIGYLKPNMKAVQRGAYMRTSSYREFVGTLLDTNTTTYEISGDKGMAAASMEAAVCMAPMNTQACARLAFALHKVSQTLKGEKAVRFEKEAVALISRVYALGNSEIITMPPGMEAPPQ